MMNISSTTVSAELGLRLVAAEQTIVPLVASLLLQQAVTHMRSG